MINWAMTISEIVSRLKEFTLVIPTVREIPPPSGQQRTTAVEVGNLGAVRASLMSALHIPVIADEARRILQSRLLTVDTETILVDVGVGSNFSLAFQALKSQRELLLRAFSPFVSEPRENGLRIKLPDSADYRGVVQDQKALLQAFEQLLLLNPNFTSPITIEGWENGSLWIWLCVGVPLAVDVIGRAVRAAAVIRKEMAQARAAEESARRYGVDNDFREHLNAKAKIAVDIIVDSEAIALYQSYLQGEHNPEALSRIKETLRILADLIDRQAEIRPALMSPEKEKEIFPDYKHLDTIASAIKQLTAGGNADGGIPPTK